MVFQHFGLLPHRQVIDNVAYGLEVRGVAKKDRRAKAGEIVDLVGLTGYEKSYPDQLSGGMQQRVGLARALAGDPEMLLFDEPFSALDPLIRRDMQNEVIRLHRELGKTMVFITHDLAEALKLGDRILIMRDGAIVQIGDSRRGRGATGRRLRQGLRLRGAQVARADPEVGDARPAARRVPRGPALPITTRSSARPPGPHRLGHPIRVVDGDTLLGVVDEEDIMRVVVAEEEGGAVATATAWPPTARMPSSPAPNLRSRRTPVSRWIPALGDHRRLDRRLVLHQGHQHPGPARS